MNNKRQQKVKLLKYFRKTHRITGAWLFALFLIMALSGILLGLKKHSGQLIMPKTHVGSTSDFNNWLPLDSLNQLADMALQAHADKEISKELDRVDIRKNKGVAKFIYTEKSWSVQIDGATGEVLNIGKRHSDVIENIHDGSVLDKLFNTGTGIIKLIYTLIMGLALLVFTVTGFWLWLGPKQLKK